uniref:Uncharacterized protein n=1 Tax=Sipha flava TaxID=143950 RepID=A0A2S2Q0K8_9HEMI
MYTFTKCARDNISQNPFRHVNIIYNTLVERCAGAGVICYFRNVCAFASRWDVVVRARAKKGKMEKKRNKRERTLRAITCGCGEEIYRRQVVSDNDDVVDRGEEKTISRIARLFSFVSLYRRCPEKPRTRVRRTRDRRRWRRLRAAHKGFAARSTLIYVTAGGERGRGR